MSEGCAPNDRRTKQKIEQLNTDLHGDQNLEDEINSYMDGVNDKALNCFLQVGLQEGTLKTELTDKDCTFLVNLINDQN
jgi:hypothetical protein